MLHLGDVETFNEVCMHEHTKIVWLGETYGTLACRMQEDTLPLPEGASGPVAILQIKTYTVYKSAVMVL